MSKDTTKHAEGGPAYTTAPVTASPANDAEFVDALGLHLRFGIKRSLAYTLLSEGAIRGVSLRRRGQLRRGSFIQSVPRKAWNAGECAQISPNECSRTFQNSRFGMVSAAWHGNTLPVGVTFKERRPQPPTQGFG